MEKILVEVDITEKIKKIRIKLNKLNDAFLKIIKKNI